MEKETLETFLRRLEMGDSIVAFKEQNIDLDLLQKFTEKKLEETLKEMEITIGNRKKVCLEIKALKSGRLFISFILYLNYITYVPE